MKRSRLVVIISFALSMSTLSACSTGTADHGLFAHTENETLLRVASAIPIGTEAGAAMATLKQAGWNCFRQNHALVFIPGRADGHPFWVPDAIQCEAYPSIGGYPWSKGYHLDIVLQHDKVAETGVKIFQPEV